MVGLQKKQKTNYFTSIVFRTSEFVVPWYDSDVVSIHRNIKNTRNNYSTIFIVLGALKSLLCFPLDTGINDILNFRTNYLLRKCRKKEIANKYDYFNTRLLIVTFHEITIKYESELKIQFVLLDISTNHNVGFPRSLHLKFCQIIYLFKTFIMLWRTFIYTVGYLLMTFQKSRRNLKHLSNTT